MLTVKKVFTFLATKSAFPTLNQNIVRSSFLFSQFRPSTEQYFKHVMKFHFIQIVNK